MTEEFNGRADDAASALFRTLNVVAQHQSPAHISLR